MVSTIVCICCTVIQKARNAFAPATPMILAFLVVGFNLIGYICNFFTQLKLVNPSEKRVEHLTTQLKWRLQEGQGEAIYEIGVEDNGLLAGLSRDEMRKSLTVLTTMATKLGSEATVLRENLVDGSQGEEDERVVAEVLVRKVPDDQQVNKMHLPLVLVKIYEKYEIELKHDLQLVINFLFCFQKINYQIFFFSGPTLNLL